MENHIPQIVIVDDSADMRDLLSELLVDQGYQVYGYDSALSFFSSTSQDCDLIISDISMPNMSGYELCRRIRERKVGGRIPIILISGSEPTKEKAKGIAVGADDFIGKPFVIEELRAKIESLLAIRAKEIESLELIRQLSRFLSPNVRTLFAKNNEQLLKPHKTEVTVLFTDLRRFTSLVEWLDPEIVLELLEQYYEVVGSLAMKYLGTIGHLAGDGVMVFFNDPKPMPHHRELAVRMALETQEALCLLRNAWNAQNYNLDFGIGIADGVSTVGQIGLEKFSQYTVIGSAPNLASRLCSIAENGQILASKRFVERINRKQCEAKSIGEVSVKGIESPVNVFNIVSFDGQAVKKESA